MRGAGGEKGLTGLCAHDVAKNCDTAPPLGYDDIPLSVEYQGSGRGETSGGEC